VHVLVFYPLLNYKAVYCCRTLCTCSVWLA